MPTDRAHRPASSRRSAASRSSTCQAIQPWDLEPGSVGERLGRSSIFDDGRTASATTLPAVFLGAAHPVARRLVAGQRSSRARRFSRSPSHWPSRPPCRSSSDRSKRRWSPPLVAIGGIVTVPWPWSHSRVGAHRADRRARGAPARHPHRRRLHRRCRRGRGRGRDPRSLDRVGHRALGARRSDPADPRSGRRRADPARRPVAGRRRPVVALLESTEFAVAA